MTVASAIFIQKATGVLEGIAAFDLNFSLTFIFSSLIQYRQHVYLCKEKGMWHLGTGCQTL